MMFAVKIPADCLDLVDEFKAMCTGSEELVVLKNGDVHYAAVKTRSILEDLKQYIKRCKGIELNLAPAPAD